MSGQSDPVAIPLGGQYGHGLFVMVDACDAESVRALRWLFRPGTARRGATVKSSGRRQVVLARFILGLDRDDPRLADHINGNVLDNRRANLRVATRAENNRNRRRTRGAVPFKGVCRNHDRFAAQIKVDGKRIHLGLFDLPIDAAMAYDRAAIEHHGEFAATNEALGLLLQDGES